MPHYLGKVFLLSPLSPASGPFWQPLAACKATHLSCHPHYKGRQNTLAKSYSSNLVSLHASMKYYVIRILIHTC